MSRQQLTDTYNKANSQNDVNFGNAQNSYKAANEDIADYKQQLSKFAAGDPFTKGGEYDVSSNRVLSDTAGGISTGMRSALQSVAARTGQNQSGVNATAEAIADQAQRNLGAQQAEAQRDRIGKEVGYNKDVLAATEEPFKMHEGLYGTSSGAAGQDLGVAERSAEANKSFMDTLGTSFANELGSFLGSGGNFSWSKKFGK